MCTQQNVSVARASKKLRADEKPLNFTMGASLEDPMSYAEAKQIALLRLELRTCWEKQDFAGAGVALARLTQVADNDNELTAEVRRWAIKLQVA
jgi:hypothetical protein